MRLQGFLNGPDDIVAAVFPVQAHVIPKHSTRPDVNDDQEPDTLDLEPLLKSHRIAQNDCQSYVQTMTVEFDNLQRMGGRRVAVLACAGHTLGVLGTGGFGGPSKVVKAASLHPGA